MLECLPTLFPEQKTANDSTYVKLVSGLTTISSNIITARRKANTNDALLLIDRKYAEEINMAIYDAKSYLQTVCSKSTVQRITILLC